MPVADLAGRSLGRFQLVRRLGEGTSAVVYLARHGSSADSGVALKVLDPALVARAGFHERFRRDITSIAAVGHPHVMPVYDYGTSSGLTFMAMGFATGGSLRERMMLGPIDPEEVWGILGPVAEALHRVHELGITHLDVKPSNVFFDSGGSALVADFGLARTYLGFAVGTPGYMSPEQARGEQPDRRADVYGLAVVAFEMLTGTRLLDDQSTLPELLMATVHEPAPSALARRPELPPEIESVLARALAKQRDYRHQSTVEFLWDLTRALGRGLSVAVPSAAPFRDLPALPPPASEPPAMMAPLPGLQHPDQPETPGLPGLPGAVEPAGAAQIDISPDAFKGTFAPAALPALDRPGADSEREFKRAESQLMKVFETALSAAVAVDESSFIVSWNVQAEDTFGWPRDEIIGRSLSSTIIPAQYREAHERGFMRFLETGEGPVLGKVIEITAMHRDGREFPIELSISPAARHGKQALFVAFARDITQQRRTGQLKAARDAVAEALRGSRTVRANAPRVLEAVGVSLGWDVGVLWVADGTALRAKHVWKADSAECPDLEKAISEAEFQKGAGVPGRVWDTGDPVWVEDVLREPGMALALPALRAGLHAAVGIPILQKGEVRGVLEFFSSASQKGDDELLGRLFDLGRRLGASF